MGMDFANASRRVRTLLAPAKPADLQKSSLAPDTLRDNIIREQELSSERFQSAIKKKPTVEYERTHEDGSTTREEYEWETYEEAARDFARAAFGWDEPETVGRDKVRPSYRFNREVLQAAINSEAMRELRPHSRNNPTEATYGAMAYADKLLQVAQERCAEHIERSEQMSEHEQAINDADKLLENLRDRARQETNDLGTAQKDTRRGIKTCLKSMDLHQQALSNLMQEESASSVTIDAIAAGEAAAEAAADAVEAISNVPGLDPGQSAHMSPDAQMALAEKWAATDRLRTMAKRLGRMVRSFQFKHQARTKNVPIQPVGIECGDDFERLLPGELARGAAANTVMRLEFLRGLEDRSLLQYEKRGKSPAGKGPIITVEDGSGSMSTNLGGLSREGWAKSFGLMLLKFCRAQKRDFGTIQFASRGQLKSWFFPKRGEPDPDTVLDFATHFFNGGGTHTASGLAEALRIIREAPEFKTADVVLIGDGADRVKDEDLHLRNELRELGVRIHGISIGTPSNSYMKQICDHAIDVTDLANDEDGVLMKVAENIT